MTHRNQQIRQARVRRGLDGVVASYLRDISRTGAPGGRPSELPEPDRPSAAAALAANRDDRAAA
jgi:hypothetical protein